MPEKDPVMHIVRRLGCGRAKATELAAILGAGVTDIDDPQELANACAKKQHPPDGTIPPVESADKPGKPSAPDKPPVPETPAPPLSKAKRESKAP